MGSRATAPPEEKEEGWKTGKLALEENGSRDCRIGAAKRCQLVGDRGEGRGMKGY